MKKTGLLSTVAFFLFAIAFAQQDSLKTVKGTKIKHDRNFVKINLAALLLKNYSFQYERVLTKGLSVAINYRTSPMSGLPFKTSIVKLVGDDEETTRQVENLLLGNSAITPELRLYVGKGFGKGFYFAPFYRHANYSIKGAEFNYSADSGAEETMALNGKLTSNTYGLVLGSQFFLGKRITLDIWYLGPHFGSGKGQLTGTPSSPLSADEQADLRQGFDDIDIPFATTSSEVTASKAALNLDGSMAGLRFGIVLGVKF